MITELLACFRSRRRRRKEGKRSGPERKRERERERAEVMSCLVGVKASRCACGVRPRGSNGTTASFASRTRIVTRAKVREIFMPALSSTMTEGKIVSWLKAAGDKINKGESIVVVESDKVSK